MSPWPPIKREHLPLILVPLVLTVYSYWAWFVTDPVRASLLDRLILHNTDTSLRFLHIRHSLEGPAYFLNSYSRPLYTLIATLFYHLLPGEMLSLRMMNVLFSGGTLVLLVLLCRRLKLSPAQASLALLITATSPSYLLHSISIQASVVCSFGLLLSLYLLTQKRLLASVAVSSLLPLVRPEGLIGLVLWALFILRQRGRHGLPYLLLLGSPLLAWISLNRLVLGPGVWERIQYHTILLSRGVFGQNPFENISLDLEVLTRPLVGYLSFMGLPLMALALVGLITKLPQRRYGPLLAVLLCYFSFYIIFVLPVGFGLEKMSMEGLMENVAMPIIPVLALVASLSLDPLGRLGVRARTLVLLFAGVIIISGNVLTLWNMRLHQGYHWRPAILPRHSEAMGEAAGWLAREAQQRGVKRVYLSAEDTVSGYTNLFLKHLPADVDCLMVFNQQGRAPFALSLATFISEPFARQGSLYLAGSTSEANIGRKLGGRIIRKYDAVPLYFYEL